MWNYGRFFASDIEENSYVTCSNVSPLSRHRLKSEQEQWHTWSRAKFWAPATTLGPVWPAAHNQCVWMQASESADVLSTWTDIHQTPLRSTKLSWELTQLEVKPWQLKMTQCITGVICREEEPHILSDCGGVIRLRPSGSRNDCVSWKCKAWVSTVCQWQSEVKETFIYIKTMHIITS